MKPVRLAWWIWIVTVVAIILWALPNAHADDPVHVYDDGGTVIKLWDRPCNGRVAAMVAVSTPEKFHDRFKEITSTFATTRGDRVDFAGCWLFFPKEELGTESDAIYMLFEDGDQYLVKPESFKRYPRKGEQAS